MTEKVEMAEQTPLKSDTDAAEGAVVEGGDVVAPTETTKVEKKRFFWQKKKTEGDVEAPAAEKEAGEPAEKKKCWWQRKCPAKCEKEPQECSMDLTNRDTNNLQSTIDLSFSDIFGEPTAVHSINGVWKFTNSVFNFVRNFIYKLLTFVFAIPLAIVFGVLYALVSALNVFVCVPVGRLLSIPAGWLFKTWSFVIGNVFDPVFRSLGLVMSNVSVRRYGINTEVTQPFSA